MTAPTAPVDGMVRAMHAAGILPTDPSAIAADGVLRRFHGDGHRPGTRNVAVALHHDHGFAQDWKTGATCTWSAKSTTKMSRAERDVFYAQIRAAKAEAQRQREVEQQHAAERAAHLWAKTKPARADHPYLVRKRIEPGYARQMGDMLVLKIEDIDGAIRSLQYIGPDGIKRMLTGGAKKSHFVIVSGSLPAQRVLICEGWATGMSLATQHDDAAVLAAVDCGNLRHVAEAVRRRYPDEQIVVGADDDRLINGNPGLTKAREAAAAVGGRLIRPAWPEGSPQSLTDFNDLAAWLGDYPEAAHA